MIAGVELRGAAGSVSPNSVREIRIKGAEVRVDDAASLEERLREHPDFPHNVSLRAIVHAMDSGRGAPDIVIEVVGDETDLHRLAALAADPATLHSEQSSQGEAPHGRYAWAISPHFSAIAATEQA